MKEEIGTEHGLIGYFKWLRAQPGIPTRGPLYDPNNLKTWPWIDKYERTLHLLVGGHDEGLPPSPSPDLGVFSKPWAFVRDPRSGYETEKLEELKKAGYGSVALNVGDHAYTEWVPWISKAQDLWVIPWARIWTLEDVSRVLDIAAIWGSPALILNLEQQDGDPRWPFTGEEVAEKLTGVNRTIGISTESWMPDNFNWEPLIARQCVCLPQSLVNEHPTFTPKIVVVRARSFGWRKISPSFGTYTTALLDPNRSDYPWISISYGIYTVDDLGVEEIAAWGI